MQYVHASPNLELQLQAGRAYGMIGYVKHVAGLGYSAELQVQQNMSHAGAMREALPFCKSMQCRPLGRHA